MTGLIQVETVSVKKIRRAFLPLVNGRELDLESAYKEMKGNILFKVKYNPDFGFKALYISVKRANGKACFIVFKNGIVTISGSWTGLDESCILTFLWDFFLRPCVL
jgi:hypothetical protein